MIAIASTTATGQNLYPRTPWHRGFPEPGPTDTMIDLALQVDADGPFEMGAEDLETIAASLLLPWRDPPPEVVAQAEVISEAYRHDQGLVPWRPGRRGIVAPHICGIARICFAEAPITWRRSQVYNWLLCRPVMVDDWEPPPVMGITVQHVTLVNGPLWRAWEVSPVGVTTAGEVGVHPGAASSVHLKKVKFKKTDGPQEMIMRVLDAVRSV